MTSKSVYGRRKYVGINNDTDEDLQQIYKEEMDSLMDEKKELGYFRFWLVLSQAIGFTCIIITLVWCGLHLGGFAWQSNPAIQFNYHPLFMVIGLIFCYGDAILVYRAFRHNQKKPLKLLHFGLHTFAFIFTVVALKAVFDSHNLKAEPLPNLYSAHSWIGLSTVIFFAMQYLFGFVAFLFPGMNKLYRTKYLPVHVFFGLAIFVMAVASALMGIAEKVIFSVSNFNQLPAGAVTANLLSFSLVIFCGLVVYIVSTPQFKRQMLPEEVQLHLEKQSPSN